MAEIVCLEKKGLLNMSSSKIKVNLLSAIPVYHPKIHPMILS